MATRTDSTSSLTFSGSGSKIKSISFADMYTLASNTIPKYSTINSVTLKAYIRETTNKLGNADFYVFFGNDNADSIKELYYGNGKIPKNNKSDLEVTLDLTGYVASNTSNAGRVSYSGANNLCFRCQSSLLSRDYQLSFSITYDFSYPTHTVITVAGEGGTVSEGGTFEIKMGTSSMRMEATPNDGYKFVKWVCDDGTVSTNPVIYWGMTHNDISAHSTTSTHTAYFELDKIEKTLIDNLKPKKIFIDNQEVKAIYIDTTKVYG